MPSSDNGSIVVHASEGEASVSKSQY
jgi:hypothetical protein